MASSTPKLVSVVVPIYNMEHFLEETVNAILASDYSNFEVILMDDGSKDSSWQLAQELAAKDARIRAYHQDNGGASAARNHAIRLAKGYYILPVDADNNITPTYMRLAAEYLDSHPKVKVVSCQVEYFGDKSGPIKFAKFSREKLAVRNMIDNCAMYRKSDWEACGGYTEHIKGREDWVFWISIFRTGGEFYRLPVLGFYYRVHANSKRLATQKRKRILIDDLNALFPDFFEECLGGPLHYHRSWSKLLNRFKKERKLGHFESWDYGDIIYQGRNTLRKIDGTISKKFATPPIWRGIIYGFFRKSKARRSYEYALKLQGLTPAPIAYRELRYCGILRESWYACKQSECQHTFNELINCPDFPNRTAILQAIGRFTATLHRQGVLHADYSGGNILFNDDGSLVQVIDLNRIRFHKNIGTKQGLKNFERLNIDREALGIMAAAYAQEMQIDAKFATEYIIAHRWSKHVKHGITNL